MGPSDYEIALAKKRQELEKREARRLLYNKLSQLTPKPQIIQDIENAERLLSELIQQNVELDEQPYDPKTIERYRNKQRQQLNRIRMHEIIKQKHELFNKLDEQNTLKGYYPEYIQELKGDDPTKSVQELPSYEQK